MAETEHTQLKQLLDLSLFTYLALLIIGYFLYHNFVQVSIQNYFPLAGILVILVLTYALRNKVDEIVNLKKFLVGYTAGVIIIVVAVIAVILIYPIS